MAKMTTQLDLLKKHVIGSSRKGVNVVGSTSGLSLDDISYDGCYNEEVHYMGNQMMGSQLAFPRPFGK